MPKDADRSDQDLLARLNALRPSNISLSQSSPNFSNTTGPVAHDTTTSKDLTARFAKLGGAVRNSVETANADTAEPSIRLNVGQDAGSSEPNAEDDRTIDELLADLGPDEAWQLEKDDETQAADLLQEAKAALKKSQELDKAAAEDESAGEIKDNAAKEDRDVGDAEREDQGDEPRLTEDQEADEIIQRLLAETSLEERLDANLRTDDSQIGPSHRDAAGQAEDNDESDGDGDLFQLPTAPTALPSSTQSPNHTLLPSAPDTLPSSSRNATVGASSQLQKFTDEEIDTWCIICNSDATVRCLGCDGDLYCGNCWYEGHKSPEAGYEERSHKAVAFVKPGPEAKKPAKTKQRRLAA